MKQILIILIICCSFQGFGQIKGYWRFDGNLLDGSGYSNNMTIMSGSVAYEKTVLNSGITISDGTILSANTLPQVASGMTDPFTFSCWFKTTSLKYFVIASRINGAACCGYFGWGIGSNIYDTNGITFYLNKSQVAESPLAINNCITANKWYYLTIVYDGTNQNAYLNSKLIGSRARSFTGATAVTTRSFLIGSSSPYGFSGSLDNIIMTNTAWSAAKVKNEYSRVKGFYQN